MVTRRRLLQTGIAGTFAGLAGCSGLSGDTGTAVAETPTDETVDETPTPTPTGTPVGCTTPVEVSGEIVEDTTWDCESYRLTGNLRVGETATLTVSPGVEVVAEESVRLAVTDDSTLLVEGTDDSPVVVRGDQAVDGYWDGIEFDSTSTESKLSHTEVANGGTDGFANVFVQGGSGVALDHCTFRDCSTYGVVAARGARFPTFAVNTFAGNGRGAIQVAANTLGDLDADSTYAGGSDGTDVERIEVRNETVTDAATWPATDVRVFFAEMVSVRAAVTVEPGAGFTFAQDTRLSVDDGGSLTAAGNSDSRIGFRGESAVPGFWDGIVVDTNNSGNRLSYVDVADGGNSSQANVFVEDGARVAVDNCTLSDSSTYGIFVDHTGMLPSFGANDFEGNLQGVIRLAANALGDLDSASTYGGGPGPDRIEVHNEIVTNAATWSATDVRVFFAEMVSVRSAVTVEPGAEFTFAESTRISIREGGSFNAVGSPVDTTAFGLEEGEEGPWDGFEFASLSGENVLEHCEVAGGGNDNLANVYVRRTGAVTVRNCVVRNSATYGIVVARGGQLTEEDNQFRGNATGDILRL